MLEPGGGVVRARWGYDPADPWAVSLTLRARRRWVLWRFDRELLAAGLRARAGLGDVRIEPFGDAVLVELRSPDGHALLYLPGVDVARLLAASYRRVPPGGEHLDWDELDIELQRIGEDSR